MAIAESTLFSYANDGTCTLTKLGTGQQLTDAERACRQAVAEISAPEGRHNLDSMGLFQQRPGTGRGEPATLIDPVKSAGLFVDRLVTVSGWQEMNPWNAGQAVQGSPSSDGGIYETSYNQAVQIVATLRADGTPGGVPSDSEVPSSSSGAVSASAPTTAAAPSGSSTTPTPSTAPNGQVIEPSTSAVPVAPDSGCGSSPSASGSVDVVLDGPNVTLPNQEDVDPAGRGKAIKTPNEKVAKGLPRA